MHLVDFQAQSHLPKIILNGFCFMTVNVQMYYETEQKSLIPLFVKPLAIV